MRLPLKILACLSVLSFGSASAADRARPDPAGHLVSPSESVALDAVVHDACPHRFVLLGEGPTHGDGATEAFKVALIERLVDRCGFRSVVFEASQYEFLNLRNALAAHRPLKLDDLAASVGAYRGPDREFQPLLPFLLSRAEDGRIDLAGLDDQIGSVGETYANDEMIPDLAIGLPQQEKADCIEAFRRKAYFDYPEAPPYSPADRERLLACLRDMARFNALASASAERIERSQMIEALQRYVGRDDLDDHQRLQARDRSMFQTFEWLLKHRYVEGKTIVWMATVHAVKSYPGFGENFGSLMQQAYGDRAFVLGFSALGGTYRVNRHQTAPLPAAPARSLEARVMAKDNADVAYVGPSELAAIGLVDGAALDHAYRAADWTSLLDGVVIFRQEFPPHR